MRLITSGTEWAEILPHLPNAHPLQTWSWGDLKSRWGWTHQGVVWEENNQPVAGALLLTRKIGRTPFSFLYTPKGPLLDWQNAALRKQVLSDLETIGKEQNALFLKIDPDVVKATGEDAAPISHGEIVVNELERNGWRYSPEQIQFKNTVMVDLTQSEDDLLAKMKSKTRYNIRLAKRKGVEIRDAMTTDFPKIADLFVQTAQRNGFLIRPKQYYLDMWGLFYRDNALIPLVAEYGGEIISAVMILHTNQVAIYKDGASSDKERNRMPTYLIQWEAIKRAKAAGCTLYDMWGAPDIFDETDSMWGVYRFKRGWNGTVTHTVGAYDLPLKPRLYNLFINALPRYRTLLHRQG